MTDPVVDPSGPVAPAKPYPPQSSIDNVNGIVDWLGVGKTFTRVEANAGIDAWLKQSSVAYVDYTWVKSNFIHMSTDHADMMLAYYGIQVTFSWAADGITGQVSFSRP